MSDVAAILTCAGAFPSSPRVAVRRIRAAPEHGVDGRQTFMQRTAAPTSATRMIFPCNKRGLGSGCAALHGLNRKPRDLRLVGCVRRHDPSDVAVALAASTRRSWCAGPRAAERSRSPISIAAGDTPERDNVLGRGDLIVSIDVPACAEVAPRTT